MITTQTNLHGVTAADIGVGQAAPGVVTIRFGDNLTVYIKDVATIDALHIANEKAYELLVEGVVAS